MMKKKILAIIGSTKNRSTNWLLVKTLEGLAADRADITIYEEITALPFFNPDLDNDMPPETVTQLRDQIRASDAVIICIEECIGMDGFYKSICGQASGTAYSCGIGRKST
jgi:chromate reductase